MPRQVSLEMMQDMLAQQAENLYVETLKISHPDLPSDLYFVNDEENLVLGSTVYQAFPFSITLPSDDEENVPIAKLEITIVDLQIVDVIRSISTPPDLELNIVNKNTATVEVGPIKLKTLTVTVDEFKASFSLTINRNILNDAFPKSTFNPSNPFSAI